MRQGGIHLWHRREGKEQMAGSKKTGAIGRVPAALGTVALALAVALGAAACGGARLAMIGTKTDGCASFELTNGLGHAVTAMAARDGASEDDFPASFMGEDQGLEADATAEVELPEGLDATNVDLMLTCDDGSQVVVEDVDVTVAEEFTAKSEDGVGFLAYKDADGNERDTKGASLAAKQAREQAAADAQAASAVAAQIEALPAVDALTLDDATKQAVGDARAAYDALTEAQRALVPAEDGQGLADREARLATMQQKADEEAAAAAAKAQAEAEAAARARRQTTSSSSGGSGYSGGYGSSSRSTSTSTGTKSTTTSSGGSSGGSSSAPAAPSQSTEDCTRDNIALDN